MIMSIIRAAIGVVVGTAVGVAAAVTTDVAINAVTMYMNPARKDRQRRFASLLEIGVSIIDAEVFLHNELVMSGWHAVTLLTRGGISAQKDERVVYFHAEFADLGRAWRDTDLSALKTYAGSIRPVYRVQYDLDTGTRVISRMRLEDGGQ
jgi:acyl-coenzyme A thioesterase PaaI-like protein